MATTPTIELFSGFDAKLVKWLSITTGTGQVCDHYMVWEE